MIKAQGGGPLYHQLAALLREEIHTGRIQPGQKLPSETTLQQSYGVNRLTARAAVNVLRAEGLAELVRGLGVVVREPADVQDLLVPPGSTVMARMPTVEERQEQSIPAGVPVFTIDPALGHPTVYPADRWRLRTPADS